MNEIDYCGLSFVRQRELDQKIYSKYYDSCFEDIPESNGESQVVITTPPLPFNQWYGSKLHKKAILPYQRKLKLIKLKEKADI